MNRSTIFFIIWLFGILITLYSFGFFIYKAKDQGDGLAKMMAYYGLFFAILYYIVVSDSFIP